MDGNQPGLGRRTLRVHAPCPSDDIGAALYSRRQVLIEPVFADTKSNRRIDRFHRRGQAAYGSEWRLINAAHNLLKLHKHHVALTPA